MKIVKGQPFPLGVEKIENRINFSLSAPSGKSVNLLLYRERSSEPDEVVKMESSVGEVRCIALEKVDGSLLFYNYEINGEIIADPYVKAISGKHAWGEKKKICMHEIRGKIYEKEFEWEEDKPLEIPYEDVIAYSLHVRGFTMDPHSEVSSKGTFEGIAG